MGFQSVFDNAETISINKRRKVAQTQSRDGTVKAVSLGGQIWRFEVKLPDGPRWTDYRPIIEKIEALDRVTTDTVQINDLGKAWLSGYQGNVTNQTGIQASYTSGNTITITTGTSGLVSGQFVFKSGDLVQLGTGSVYTVVSDVPYNQTTVTLHRPVRETAGTYTLQIGQNVSWNVICVQFPKWTIFSRDQIQWDGPFIFAEAI